MSLHNQEGQDVVVGRCMKMCPDAELIQREKEGLLHYMETRPNTKHKKRPTADPDKVVKEFRRPAAGRPEVSPIDLRPAPVLQMTVSYLMNRILPLTSHPFHVIYDFIFDRLRAVRQDMVMQQLETGSVTILETTIRFLLYARYRLCDAPVDVFYPKIHDQHTQECMKRLLVLYRDLNNGTTTRNQKEFESLYLLYNLGDTDALRHALQLSKEFRKSAEMQFALAANWAYLQHNYVRLFKLLNTGTCNPLQLAAVHRHIGSIQRDALLRYNTAFSSKVCKYPADRVQSLFGFNSSQNVVEVCEQCGILVTGKNIQFMKGQYKPPERPLVEKWMCLERVLHQVAPQDLVHGISLVDGMKNLAIAQ